MIEFQKVHGTEHCADLMTKGSGEVDINKYMDTIGAMFQSGRAEIVAKAAESVHGYRSGQTAKDEQRFPEEVEDGNGANA